MNFMNAVKNELVNGRENVAVTENGALGYKTTGHALLDMNFATSSLRNADEGQILDYFRPACAENLPLAVTWLFFCRDIRGGMGERTLFRVCLKYLGREWPQTTRKLLKFVPEYGRWDDLWCLLGTKMENDVIKLVADTLSADLKTVVESDKPISLLGKWMPSENASSPATRARARALRIGLGMKPSKYRRVLSALRERIDIIERKMSSKEWQDINYEAVPSKANLIYNKAFLRHDEERRRDFLRALENNEVKINASAVFPYEIVHKYPMWDPELDETIEAMWKALPDFVGDGVDDIMVVVDGSGSMNMACAGGCTAWDVANSLGIYFAERLKGPYHNKFITFSSRPEMVDLSGASTLLGKLQICHSHDDCSNTNIERTFDLILSTAVRNHLSQDELPGTVMIISDMEFDDLSGNRYTAWYWGDRTEEDVVDQKLFDGIAKKFAAEGYKMPRLVFWNVNSRTGAIPVKENELGVALISGFSPAVSRMVLSGKLDAYSVLLEMLMSERYAPVREVMNAKEG